MTRQVTTRLRILATELRAVEHQSTHLTERWALALADGYPSGGAGPAGSSSQSSVEAAVTARVRADDDYQRYLAALSKAIDGLVEAQAVGRPWLAEYHRDDRLAGNRDKERATCHGGVADEGGPEWGVLECPNIVGEKSETGLCDRCRKRRDRWRRRAGLVELSA